MDIGTNAGFLLWISTKIDSKSSRNLFLDIFLVIRLESTNLFFQSLMFILNPENRNKIGYNFLEEIFI